jgi:hypothetical protein
MKSLVIRTLLPLVLTLASLWGLVSLDPFRMIREVFAHMGTATREGAKISSYYINPLTQEVSGGEGPLSGLQTLERYWCSAMDQTRVVLFGNSQTFSVLLAPQEPINGEEERTYPDLMFDHLRASGKNIQGYRLSAPNISYMEVLWYLRYLLTRPCLIPNEIIVQLNFESFRKLDVRAGMLGLLEDRDFAAAAEAEARSSAPYAAAFQQAIDQFQSRVSRDRGDESRTAPASKTGISESHGIGGIMETWVREALDRFGTFRARSHLKAEFLDALYMVRVHVLGISPTMKRSIGGAALAMNVSSLERIGDFCRQHSIRIAFFNAPQNPATPLYANEEVRQQYLHMIHDLSRKYAWRYANFENSIPKDLWGVWMDGPDPIHFGRAAHRLMSELMLSGGLIEEVPSVSSGSEKH